MKVKKVRAKISRNFIYSYFKSCRMYKSITSEKIQLIYLIIFVDK